MGWIQVLRSDEDQRIYFAFFCCLLTLSAAYAEGSMPYERNIEKHLPAILNKPGVKDSQQDKVWISNQVRLRAGEIWEAAATAISKFDFQEAELKRRKKDLNDATRWRRWFYVFDSLLALILTVLLVIWHLRLPSPGALSSLHVPAPTWDVTSWPHLTWICLVLVGPVSFFLSQFWTRNRIAQIDQAKQDKATSLRSADEEVVRVGGDIARQSINEIEGEFFQDCLHVHRAVGPKPTIPAEHRATVSHGLSEVFNSSFTVGTDAREKIEGFLI